MSDTSVYATGYNETNALLAHLDDNEEATDAALARMAGWELSNLAAKLGSFRACILAEMEERKQSASR